MHDASSLMVGSVNMVLLLVFAVGVALLFKSGSRAVGAALLGILGALAAWNVLAVRSVSRVEHYSGVNTYPDDPAADGILSASEATVAEVPLDQSVDHFGDGVTPAPQTFDEATALTDPSIQPLLHQFSPQHEMIRNQRLTMQMPGGVVTGQPSSGHWLETYPDGMQIERVNNGQRRLVRDSDYDASSPQYGTTSTSHSSYGRVWLFAPFSIIALMLLAGFVVGAIIRARRRRGDDPAPRSGWGATVMGFNMILFVVIGLLFFGYERVSRRTVVQGVESSVTNLFDAQRAAQEAARVQVEQAKAYAAASQQLVDSVNQSSHAATSQLAAFIEHAPIEQLLGKMTAPRIMLTPPRSVSTSTDAHQELADAAKKVLAASIPGADPFTQSWLVDAAKTFVTTSAQHAAPRTEPHAGEARFSGPDAKRTAHEASNAAKQAAVAEATQADREPTPSDETRAKAAAATLRRLSNEQSQKIAKIEAGIVEGRIPPAGGEKTIERLDKLRANLNAAAAAAKPKPKPEWLANPPGFSGEVRRYVVSVGPYVTMPECEEALAREMREIVQKRFRDAVASNNGLPEGHWSYDPDVTLVGISDAEILREFVADEYVEKVDASVGEMLKAHALLEFGPQEDARLVDHWKHWMRRGRLEDVVNFSALAVMGLAFVFGLLKIDTWTRGYYTKRLFLGVPAAIIGLFFFVMLVLD